MIEKRKSNGPILGRYQTISELAKSRIGGLIMALDLPEQRLVALRSLPVEGRFSSESATRLLEAGRWVKGLEDPAVMTPLEVGTQEGLLHAAYLYSVSEPLRGILRLTSFKGHAVPVGVALRIAHDITLGARAVEACGAPPRVGDSLCGALLPDSVLVGEDGRTRLCDVGIAAVLRREAMSEHPDIAAYAAPEQANGAGPTDGRTDVFTIGIFLWEMLANRRLFSLNEPGQPRTFEVPPIESSPRAMADPISAAVTALVRRALEPVAANRFAGTTALLQALETQCRDILAPHAAVKSFMADLFGNIFENRARTIEAAMAAIHSGSRDDLTAPPAAVRDASPRAAAPKNQAASEGVKERVAPVSNSNGNPTDLESPEISGIDESAPDTTRELTPAHAKETNEAAPETGRNAAADSAASAAPPSRLPSLPAPPPQPPMRSTKPAPVFGSRQPLMPALPALPRQFELPGAELFATPGLPLVKPRVKVPTLGVAPSTPAPALTPAPAAPAAPAPARVPAPALAPASTDPVEAKVNPVGPTIPAPPSLASIESETVAAAPTNVAEESAHAVVPAEPAVLQVAAVPRRRFRFTWMAMLSIVAFAFIGGVAARRCTKVEIKTPPARVEAVTVSPVIDAGDVPSEANQRGVAAEAAPDAATLADAGLSASAALDAGAPVASAVVKAPAPVKPRVYKSPAKSSSKVVKGRGKTTRSR